MALRDMENRSVLPEYEELSRKIDSFRTHKYQQYSLTEITLDSADLINEEAEIHESQKDIQISKSKYLKSLELYLEGIKYGDNSIITDYFKKIKKILNKFEEQELPTEIKIKLLMYYEKIENYSKVENLLFRLLKLKENKQELVYYGISFYNSLMAKSDQELINMNLSRDKVINSKLRLEEIKNLP